MAPGGNQSDDRGDVVSDTGSEGGEPSSAGAGSSGSDGLHQPVDAPNEDPTPFDGDDAADADPDAGVPESDADPGWEGATDAGD